MRFILYSVLLMLTMLCSSSESKPRIIGGGTNVPAASLPTVAKITLNTPTEVISGSGTLISPTHILTAGHVVTDELGAVTVTDGTATLNGGTYVISKIYVNPTWHGVIGIEGSFDAAIIELSTPVTNTIPNAIFRNPVLAGEPIFIAGYGDEIGVLQPPFFNPPDGTLEIGHNTITTVTDTFLGYTYHGNGDAITGEGDSGGPWFLQVAGVDTLVADTSYGNVSVGGIDHGVRVDTMVPWIESITKFRVFNTPVITSGPDFSVNTDVILTGQPATFAITAADPDGDDLLASWDFGDGRVAPGAPAMHTFLSPGIFPVTVSVKDSTGSTAAPISKSALVLQLANTAPTKKSISVNLRTTFGDSFGVMIANQAFVFGSKSAFAAATDGKTIDVVLGKAKIDTLMISHGKGVGSGKLTWNYRTGSIAYTRTKYNLQAIFSPYGKLNVTGSPTISIPIMYEFNGIRYGSTAVNFSYTATQGKSGKGK